MKKLILLFALAFVMCGCEPKVENGYKVGSSIYYVITIDDCEYIIWGNHCAHKGNCKYCIERRIKEQEELIRKLKEN